MILTPKILNYISSGSFFSLSEKKNIKKFENSDNLVLLPLFNKTY